MLNHGYDINASAELSVHFSSEIFLQNIQNSLAAKGTIHGRTLGRLLDSWVAIGDWATYFSSTDGMALTICLDVHSLMVWCCLSVSMLGFMH